MEEIILFGASRLGIDAYNNLKEDYKIIYFADNDEMKWGTKLIDGIEIISPEKVSRSYADRLIVISSSYYLQILNQLINLGINKIANFRIDTNKIERVSLDSLEDNYIKSNKKKIAMIKVNNSGSNVLALYRKMPEYIYNKYDVVLLDEKEKDDNYNNELISSDVIIYGHGNDFIDDKINIYLSHGIPLKAFGYMTKYENDIKETKTKNWENLDLYYTLSEMSKPLINSCIGIDGSKYQALGFPRNDFLLESNNNYYDFSKYKKVIVYMPTFRNPKNYNIGMKNIYDIDNIEDLGPYLKNNNYLLMIKYHPIEYDYYRNNKLVSNHPNIKYIDDVELRNKKIDFYEILGQTDLLITDYSSVWIDYLLLDKPILFYILDLEDYVESTGLLLQPYEDIVPGPVVDNFYKLEDEINRLFNDDGYYFNERIKIKNIFHKYTDNKSSYRIWDDIDKNI